MSCYHTCIALVNTKTYVMMNHQKLKSMTTLLLIFSIFTLPSFLTITEAVYLYHVCSNTTTFTPNSTFQSNVNRLLSTLSSNSNRSTGFYNATVQTPNNAVYGLFLCRGDVVGTDACETCVATVTAEAPERCPIEKQVVIWYDDCMLRYSDESFFSTSAESPSLYMWNTQNASGITDQNLFNKVLAATVTEVAAQTSNSSHMFATKETSVSGFITLYGFGQCTQDLLSGDCNWCLLEAATQTPRSNAGGRVLKPSCNLRFEIYPFYSSAPPPPASIREGPKVSPANIPPPVPEAKKSNRKVIIIIVVVVVLVAFVTILSSICIYSRVKKRGLQLEVEAKDDTKTVESLQFDLGTIETATNKFSDNNKLGEGGFGVVFKGTLANEQEIAVKRLSKSSRQGVQEFKNEVALVAKLQHRNLVRLLGFCLEGEETLLVYEYVRNKSLDYFLFESRKREQLDWSSRCMIIGGITRGILYLHEDSRHRVIHRDLKASNILLDENMNPKISDFGMARMFGVDDQTQGNTKRIVGTYGYMAPEYAMEGLYSIKSDVYSFGVLLLEITTGRKNFLGFHPTNGAPTLIGYAWKLWNEGKVLELMDPLLKGSCSPNEFLRYVHIGLLCVQEDANNRPTMSSVVLMLKSETISLSKPERPAFFTGRFIDHRDHVAVSAHNCSANGLTISNVVAR
ncbi:cysteine-rich receptor-like protein kinase 10 isoform X1 [Malus domestica]|uniref:cysteine-rich receptor-like protein kinase 10 isoform X1 n=1 Tax=Malus domestica TaxID=3750 RepID=UPI0010AAB097|nr:cysteine-rich receptor-like protein kinase 10 [Malus domestica]